MSDIADEAADLTQQIVDVALINRQKPTIEFTGKCHFCEETIIKGHYCDAECRHDHEKELWAQRHRKVA